MTALRSTRMKCTNLAAYTLASVVAWSAASNGSVYEQIRDGDTSKVQPDLGVMLQADGMHRWRIDLWEGHGSTDADAAPAGPRGRR